MQGTITEKIGRVIGNLVLHPRYIRRSLRHNLFQGKTPLDLGLPWFSYAAIDFLEGFLEPHMGVCEYGSGGSTLFFARRAKSVFSIEHNAGWFALVSKRLRENSLPNVTLVLSPFDFENPVGFEHSGYLHAIPAERFDVVVVDGAEEWSPVRPLCFKKAESRVKQGGIIVLDDSWRYPQIRQQHNAKRFKVFESVGPGRPGVTRTRRILLLVDFKALFGLTVIPAAVLAGTALACLSRRIRDLYFLLLVFLAPVVERVDVNFVSREWYRGTSRGYEVSVPGLLAVCLLLSSLLMPRRGERGVYWAPSLGLMLLFFVYAAANVASSSPRLFGLFELCKMSFGLSIFLAVAFYLQTERELRLLVVGLGLVVAFEGLLGLAQRYVGNIYRVYGTMDESNSLSLFFCSTAPVLVAAFNARVPMFLKGLCASALALAVVGEILTISRAGVVILGLVLLGSALTTMSFRLSARKIAICLVATLMVTGAVAKAWKTLMNRFEESTFKEEYQEKRNMGRGYYLRVAEAIAQQQFFGVGLNNWSYWVTLKYGPRLGYPFTPYKGTDRAPSQLIKIGSSLDEPQAAPAHNLAALTVGELGIPGLALFALVWLRWFQMGASFLWRRAPDLPRQLGAGLFFATCGLFLQDLTEWAYRHLPVFYTFHILLGALASIYYWRRRAARQMESAALAESATVQPPRAEVIT